MAMCLQPAAAVYSWAPWRLQRRLQRRLQLRLQLVYSGVNATRGSMFTVFTVFTATPLAAMTTEFAIFRPTAQRQHCGSLLLGAVLGWNQQPKAHTLGRTQLWGQANWQSGMLAAQRGKFP